jgi:hypothetical protein
VDQLLLELGADADGRITRQQWCSAMLALCATLSCADFDRVIFAIHKSTQSTVSLGTSADEPSYPVNNAAYVASALGKTLEQGLIATLRKMEEHHTLIASKQLWDADGYLPQKYKPERAIRILGEWLRNNNPYAAPSSGHVDPRELDWGPQVPVKHLGVGDMFTIAFHHLDETSSGCAAGLS